MIDFIDDSNSVGEDFEVNDSLNPMNLIVDPALNDYSFNSDLQYDFGVGQDNTIVTDLSDINEPILSDKGHLTDENISAPESIDLYQLENNEITFKGSDYTQSEINHNISEAKQNISREESIIRNNTSIANSKARMGEPHSFEDAQIRGAQNRLNEAKNELYKWQHTKPSK